MENFDPDLTDNLCTAEHVAMLTGAGVSKESGIPTFREAQTGLWAQYDPTELASPQAFQQDPKLVWEWYQWRRSLVADADPNPGHFAIERMETLIPAFSLITQNVDGLHQRAGSSQVIELHGSIQRSKCFRENVIVERWAQDGHIPPLCPHCGGPLRPDVVWFGENLPSDAIEAAFHAAETADVFFSVGTSGVVEPAASLPRIARSHGALLVEINPTETPLTALADFVLSGASGKILPALIDQAWPSKGANL
jgi:NAD-dependent deacetylase